jgi:hypothetical protein
LPIKHAATITDGAYDDLLIVTNIVFVGWVWFAIFCGLIHHPSWLPWNKRLWLPTVFISGVYLGLSIALRSITPVFLLVLDVIPGIAWAALIGLLFLARKKNWPWASRACAPLPGLMVLTLAFFGYLATVSLLADFIPSFAYKQQFGEFPSRDVRDIKSIRNKIFLDVSEVILAFHASRGTFQRIKSRDLTQVSYKEFLHIYQGEQYGGLLANYIRQDNLDPAGDQVIAAWCQKFSAQEVEIWHLPRNPSDTEILMTYNPNSGEVQYYFFETE